MKKSKTYRELQFENESVRVWKTMISPEDPLELHRHDNGRVMVCLKSGKLKKIESDRTTSDLNFETHKAYWLSADPSDTAHMDTNESDELVAIMVIETKGPGYTQIQFFRLFGYSFLPSML